MTEGWAKRRMTASDSVAERMLRAMGGRSLELVDLDPEPGSEANGHPDDLDGPPLHEPRLTLVEAARAAGISKDALRRRLRKGAFPNAARSMEGTWLVPVTDLLVAGLELSAREEPGVGLAVQPPDQLTSIESLQAEVTRLRSENALLRERLAMTETLASERQERIQDLRLALRMLPEVWAERVLSPDQMNLGSDALPSVGEASPEEPLAASSAPSGLGPTAVATRPNGPVQLSSNHAVWKRESGIASPSKDSYDTAARIQDLRLALEAQRAENDRLTAQLRRRWWPFRRGVSKHRRGATTTPG